jgi:L-alanine-DL-glutamate epimerase-like enolase superfamily enzyme
MGENATRSTDFRTMVAAGATDFVQPSIVKIGGISQMSKIAAEVEQAGVTCVPNVFYIGPGYRAALHCIATEERDAPLERMFCELGATPYAKTAPVLNGAVEVPEGAGLGADPEEELIAQFRA